MSERSEKIRIALEMGKISEVLFKSLMEKEGYECYTASTYQDTNEHWDINICLEDVSEFVDVKGIKMASIDERTWFELRNVEGNTGWLYAPKVDYIAFETEYGFDMYRRLDVLSLIEENLKKSDITDEGYTIYFEKDGLLDYRRYMRSNYGRKDLAVLVPFKDIQHLIYKKIYK